jgi:hypothetical protein
MKQQTIALLRMIHATGLPGKIISVKSEAPGLKEKTNCKTQFSRILYGFQHFAMYVI